MTISVLSNREFEVVTEVAKGFSAKEIATRLFLSVHTVVTHIKNAKNKTETRNSAGLTRWFVLSLDEPKKLFAAMFLIIQISISLNADSTDFKRSERLRTRTSRTRIKN